MTTFPGVLELQVDSLLDAVRRQRDERCREIIAAAEHRAKQALAQSRHRLYRRQRRAVAEERHRRSHELHMAASRLESRARRHAYARYEAILKDGWPLLIAALDKRWADSAARNAWCDMVVAEAADTLGAQTWLIEHPESWPVVEQDRVTKLVGERGLPAPEFLPDAGIRAGLRVRAGTARLDGTSAGLLAARLEVEALLLAMWERRRGGVTADG